jgi:hypothetical protein
MVPVVPHPVGPWVAHTGAPPAATHAARGRHVSLVVGMGWKVLAQQMSSFVQSVESRQHPAIAAHESNVPHDAGVAP